MPKLFRETLVHQDILTYATGLRLKVLQLVDAGISVLNEALDQMGNLPANQGALDELRRNSEAYNFEYFVSTGQRNTS